MPRGVYDRDRQQQPVQAETPQESPRAADTRRERRRRDDGDLDRNARMKLAIPREVQAQADREGRVLRWMLDSPGRIQQAVADDWDRVEGVEPVAASRSEEGKLVLYTKYRDWWEEDQRKKAKALDDREAAIKRNEVTGEGKSVQDAAYNRELAASNSFSRQPGA